MTVLYADTSALVRAFFADEVEHRQLRALLRGGADLVVTSEVARLEFASATHSAARAGRLRRPHAVLARFDEECQEDGPIALLALDPPRILPEARRLVAAHPLRTLDAMHLAVALLDTRELADEPLVLVTRDALQATAAAAEGLDVA